MRNPFVNFLSRWSVGRKLVLIYLLDLTAVIFVGSILINEKYIAINFARDELRGNAYVDVIRDSLIDLALVGTGAAAESRKKMPVRAKALAPGCELVTRVGKQSKLSLDPDLDSYYTMSLIVLRYPELLDLMHGIDAAHGDPDHRLLRRAADHCSASTSLLGG